MSADLNARLTEIAERLMPTNDGQTNTDDVPGLLAAVAAVLHLIDPETEMAFTPFGPGGGRLFDEADLRAAIAEHLTPLDPEAPPAPTPNPGGASASTDGGSA